MTINEGWQKWMEAKLRYGSLKEERVILTSVLPRSHSGWKRMTILFILVPV
jgi:hypothetical protein